MRVIGCLPDAQQGMLHTPLLAFRIHGFAGKMVHAQRFARLGEQVQASSQRRVLQVGCIAVRLLQKGP